MRILLFLLIAVFILTVIAAGAGELQNNWRSVDQTGLEAVFLSLGADGSFYIDSHTYWFQGSYHINPDVESSRLILDVEDGSDIEKIGESFTYSFELDEAILVLETSPDAGIMESPDANGRAVYIVISNDSDEEDDDDEFTIYASCFIGSLLPAADNPHSVSYQVPQ